MCYLLQVQTCSALPLAGLTYRDVLLSDGHRSLQLRLDDLDELGRPVLGSHAPETSVLDELWRQHGVTQ